MYYTLCLADYEIAKQIESDVLPRTGDFYYVPGLDYWTVGRVFHCLEGCAPLVHLKTDGKGDLPDGVCDVLGFKDFVDCRHIRADLTEFSNAKS